MSQFSLDSVDAVYTPSELNREVRMHLEAGFSRICLEAEISNLARPASGHLYFSLKDDAAQIRCAMFRTAASRASIRPENGMQVLARGRISLYEPRGEYQFIVESLEEAGVGLLQQRFEALKKKLEAEGLFAAERKQNLPQFPFRIGVISSPSGAVIRDILHVLQRRWPVAQVRLYASPVQGTEAPTALCSALARANREQWAEVLILARGGGSLEDLQAFNDETVARSVAASALPVISAVGHETDFSICDFVADLRAPTPSAAAELATPDIQQLRSGLDRSARQLTNRMQFRLQRHSQQLDHLAHRLAQQHPEARLRQQRKDLDLRQSQLLRAIQGSIASRQKQLQGLAHRLAMRHPRQKLQELRQRILQARSTLNRQLELELRQHGSRLRQMARTLDAVSPLATLGRGYAVISSVDNRKVISSRKDASSGQKIEAQLLDGRLHCTVDSISTERLPSGAVDIATPDQTDLDATGR